MLRLRSTEPPSDYVTVAGQAARLLAAAEASGLWKPQALVDRLTTEVFAQALAALSTVGVASSASLEWPRFARRMLVTARLGAAESARS